MRRYIQMLFHVSECSDFECATLIELVDYISVVRDVYEISHKKKYVPNVCKACII